MVRLRSLKNQAQTPSLAISTTGKVGKHISFSQSPGDDFADSTHSDPTDISPVDSATKIVAEHERDNPEGKSEERDAAPEIILANSAEIAELRRLHESISLKQRKKTKRQKRIDDVGKNGSSSSQSGIHKSDATHVDKEMNEDVLFALSKSASKMEDAEAIDAGEEDADQQSSDEEHVAVGARPRKQPKTFRRIGRIDVAILKPHAHVAFSGVPEAEELDPLANFPVSKSVQEFRAQMFNSNPRVAYDTFCSQKRKGPARRFSKKS